MNPRHWLIHLPRVGKVWRLALPVILTFLLQSVVNVVDVFMAGRLGSVEIAAVGMSTTVRMLVLIAILSITAGAMTLAAQAKGARDLPRLSFVARQTFSLLGFLALLLSPIGWFAAEPILTFLNSGGDPQAVIIGTGYLQILFLGTFFVMGNFAVSSLMQGAGDTLTPLYLSGSINILNIIFNYLFMFGPGPLPALGVPGAAIGTVAARVIGLIIGVYVFYSGKNVIKILPGSYRPDWQMFRDILVIGIPSGLQGVLRSGSQIFVLRIVTSTAAGTFGAAALAIGFQVESLALMPGIALNVAATSLVGQALGAWQVEEAKKWGNTALGLGIVIMSLVALPLVVFAPQIIRLFDPSAHPTVLSAGTSYLRIHALGQPLVAFAVVLNGALRGAGDTRPGMVSTVLGRWLLSIPLAYLLALPLGFGVEGVWWALVAGIGFEAGYMCWRWWGYRWLSIALNKAEVYRKHLIKLPAEVQQRYLDEVRAPLLARADVTERVSEEGAIYQLSDGEIRVHFTDRSYRIVDSDGLPVEPVRGERLSQPSVYAGS